MILNHHGLLTVGKTAREIFVLMKALIDAIDVQLKLGCDQSRDSRNSGGDLRQDRRTI